MGLDILGIDIMGVDNLGIDILALPRIMYRNTNIHMQNSIVYPETERIEVMDAIFGKNGLTQNTDVDTFQHRLQIAQKTDRSGQKGF